METLYRKSTEKPNNEGIYNTSKGLLSYSKTFGWVTIENYTISAPDYWLEEIPDPTAQLQADKEELLEVLRLHNPWSLTEIVKKLTEGNKILLHKHSYDGHGWEFHNKAIEEGEKAISEIESLIQKHKQ